MLDLNFVLYYLLEVKYERSAASYDDEVLPVVALPNGRGSPNGCGSYLSACLHKCMQLYNWQYLRVQSSLIRTSKGING